MWPSMIAHTAFNPSKSTNSNEKHTRHKHIGEGLVPLLEGITSGMRVEESTDYSFSPPTNLNGKFFLKYTF